MTTNQANRCMFMGLPESGKSSFIGALWHVVETGEINPSFVVSAQPGDRSYLNQLRLNFLNCQANERTKTENMKKIELQVECANTGKIVDFLFPDLDGEMYSTQFESRQLTKEYVDAIIAVQSLIMFINPDLLKRPYLIQDAEGLIGFVNVLPEMGKTSEIASESTVKPLDTIPKKEEEDNVKETKWSPKLCQTQVVLVDLLQMIYPKIQKPCKLCIVVSAWDVIKNAKDPDISESTPESWIENNLPLLFQFLQSKRQVLPSKIFGISAQGGKYSKTPSENEALQKKLRPSDRLIIQDGEIISSDITAPLKWLFE